ncbi:MAG TPA: NUDIX hydrolase [Plantibacter sp.]|uniref:NUDIX hydrolase n=1 Tax=unclassified Plantibacter TaxID=2624265 RepID=UPI002C1C08E2|nr:NUDIX hydrolase [Plantibacter sp.]
MTSARVLHSNPWFSVIATQVGTQSWYRVHRADSAMVVGTTPGGGLLMLRGRRDTTGEHPLLEFPCGGIEADESSEDAAARETLEESGYRTKHLRLIGSCVESPGISPAVCYFFQADVELERSAALEAGEEWIPEIISPGSLRDRIHNGEIRDGGSLAAAALLLSQNG